MNEKTSRDEGASRHSRSTHSRFRLVPFAEITLPTERADLVKGLIPKTGLTVVYGAPKTGKSYWLFDLMMHVALGRDYRGRRVHKGPVVYCAFEGQRGLAVRVEAFRQRFLSGEPTDIPFFLQPSMLDLVRQNAELVAAIKQQIGASAPVAVVLDTLNRSLVGSESSDQDMSAYVRAADAIREELNCSVIIVHHSGNDPSRPRGHTSLAGAADAQLSVKRNTDGIIVVEVELCKDGQAGEIVASKLEVVEVGEDEDGETIWSCVVVASTEPPEKGKAKFRETRLSAAEKIALTALQEAVMQNNEPAQDTVPDVPSGVPFTTMDRWKELAYSSGISPARTPDAQRIAFDRARKRLIDTGKVEFRSGFVWIRAK